MNQAFDENHSAPRSGADQKLRSLVQIMRTGSPRQVQAAQETFYDTLHSQLIRTALARSLDPHRFQDLFQETMIAVWDGLSGFRAEASMVTWVHQIFRHKVADVLRSSGHRLVHQFDEGEEDMLVSPAEATWQALSRQQVQEFLEGCLMTLRKKARNRAVAIDFVRHEYSMEEISACMNVPVGTVKRWLSEARHALASCIRRHGVGGVDG